MPIQFSFKGAILLFGGLTAINLLLIPLAISIGLSEGMAFLWVNALISSVYVSLILTFVEGSFTTWKAFIKRCVLIGALFALLTFFAQ